MLDRAVWCIEARAFKIPFTPFSHNFWVLVDGPGRIAGQFHGLAVDPATGESKAIGSSRHLLLAVEDAAIAWSLQPGQPAVMCVAGGEGRVRARWRCAQAALAVINGLGLRYPNLWQHGYKLNSNSVFNTLGQVMGFSSPALLLPTPAPGVERVISPRIVEEFRFEG